MAAASTRHIEPLLPAATVAATTTPPRQIIWMMSSFLTISTVLLFL